MPSESTDPAITDMVATWLVNESDQQDLNGAGKRIAEHAYDFAAAQDESGLRTYATLVLRTSRPGSSAREVADELSHNDYDRICWESVAKALWDANH